ncbi:MAG: 4Fe-4S dicluster domain-containing protein [Anaerolineae bacterium]|nr:4Fe-4S dicluster domain-containing protein [Anaerolineae bacterium]
MAKGMFVDTSICIGCKACQVACKEWNGLEGEPDHFTKDAGGQLRATNFTGMSYDNTGGMSATNWRQVRFVETGSVTQGNMAWYMMSDSCKHCNEAGCLEVCPTQALIRTDLGNVVVQQDVCNGCRNCIPACPFDVISYNKKTGRVNKCTLCDDRVHNGLETACAKACPTDSIVFGDVDKLAAQARTRVELLKKQGFNKAQLYGQDDGRLGGLNVFYLLLDEPEKYNQPKNPTLPQKTGLPASIAGAITSLILGLGALVAFRNRGANEKMEARKR